MARARKDRQDDAGQPRRPRPRRHRRRHPRGRAGARCLDARGVQAGAGRRRSVAYTDPKPAAPRASIWCKVLERFGIADAVKKKAVLTTGGNEAAEAVADGKAEIGVTLISEIVTVKGAKLAGAAAGGHRRSTRSMRPRSRRAAPSPRGARAFVDALTSPAMAGAGPRRGSSRRSNLELSSAKQPRSQGSQLQRASSSRRSAASRSRASSALIGSPKTKPCAYSQPS